MGLAYSKLTKAELPIHGYVWNMSGVTPVHRLRNGKYLRRYARGWTSTPAVLIEVYETREEAEQYRQAALLEHRRTWKPE